MSQNSNKGGRLTEEEEQARIEKERLEHQQRLKAKNAKKGGNEGKKEKEDGEVDENSNSGDLEMVDDNENGNVRGGGIKRSIGNIDEQWKGLTDKFLSGELSKDEFVKIIGVLKGDDEVPPKKRQRRSGRGRSSIVCFIYLLFLFLFFVFLCDLSVILCLWCDV